MFTNLTRNTHSAHEILRDLRSLRMTTSQNDCRHPELGVSRAKDLACTIQESGTAREILRDLAVPQNDDVPKRLSSS
jgi:hypothetical protein